MGYQDDLYRHLAEYKRQQLGISEPGVFRYRGRDVLREHILPISKASLNLFREAESGSVAFLAAKRHRYFHHLNSSQAFAFNLFVPYFDGGPDTAAALLRAFGNQETFAAWEPEAVPDQKEGTNIDVQWWDRSGRTTFCEVKLSESEFGKATNDDRHLEKLTKIYAPVLEGHVQPHCLVAGNFLDGYQFYRYMWHLAGAPESRMIFLLPRANRNLWSKLERLLGGVLPATRERIAAVAIEDIFETLASDANCPADHRNYALKLREKYVIQNG